MNIIRAFVERVKSQYTISQVTGHSLGGAIAMLVGIYYNIGSIVTYNSAPLYTLISNDEIDHLIKNYTGRATHFVTEDDWVNNLVDGHGKYLGEKFIIYNQGGHDRKQFLIDAKIQAFIKDTLTLEMEYLNGKLGFAIDFDKDGTIDLVLAPELLQKNNVFNGDPSVMRNGEKIGVNSESLQALGRNLLDMNGNEIDWIQTAIRACRETNDTMISKREPRQDTLVDEIFSRLQESSLNALLVKIHESFGAIQQEKHILYTLEDFDTYSVTRNFDVIGSSAGHRWFIDGNKWNTGAFNDTVRTLKNVSSALRERIEQKFPFNSEYTMYPSNLIRRFQFQTFTAIGDAFVDITNSLAPEIEKVFQGMGNRSGMKDGISEALKDVLDVQESNVLELKNGVSNLSQIAFGIAQNFEEMDNWLTKIIKVFEGLKNYENSEAGKEAFTPMNVPESYQAYLEESGIFSDVKDVVVAYDEQIQERSKALADTISNRYGEILLSFRENYANIVECIRDFRTSINKLNEMMEGNITSEWDELPPYRDGVNDLNTTTKYDSHGRLKNYFPGAVVQAISDAKRDIIPLLDTFDEAITTSYSFGRGVDDVCFYLKALISNYIYESMDLDTIVLAQKGIGEVTIKNIEELKEVIVQIEADHQGKALASYCQQIEQVITLMEYFSEMIKDCFGEKGEKKAAL